MPSGLLLLLLAVVPGDCHACCQPRGCGTGGTCRASAVHHLFHDVPDCHLCWCHAPGDMYQHMPYVAYPKTYYYFRPYNHMHVGQQQQEAAQWGAPWSQPYSRDVFENVYRATIPAPVVVEPPVPTPPKPVEPPLPAEPAIPPAPSTPQASRLQRSLTRGF